MQAKGQAYDALSDELVQTREKLSECEIQHVLAKDQLRLVEEAFAELRDVKQDDERRWLQEQDLTRKRITELDQSVQKKDDQLEELRYANRSLTAEVAEIKKDTTCMGQMLDEETKKVDKLSDRERVVRQAELDLKIQRQEVEAKREILLL